jgi:large subunit ribosomal protein L7/L12
MINLSRGGSTLSVATAAVSQILAHPIARRWHIFAQRNINVTRPFSRLACLPLSSLKSFNIHDPLQQQQPPLQQPPLRILVPMSYSSRSFRTTSYTSSDAAVATKTDETATILPPSSNDKNSNDAIPPPILWTTHRLKPEQIQKIDTIFHQILWLDMFEASMLNEIINTRMGTKLNAKQKRQLGQLMEQRAQEAVGNASSNGNNDGDATEEVEAGPVLVDIKLASYDASSKIKVIKEVRSILNLGLKEAKELVESAPVTLQKGMKQEMAEELKVKLESVGAKIELQ